jgi:hydroxylamine reductase (hybrid-cluster protein)
MFNCKNKEENNSIKSKEVSFKYKKSNLTSVSLYNMKKFNNVSFSNGLNNHKKEVKSTLKNANFDTDNLFSTSVESFEIKSSYRNLNQATEGKYIKDEKLQEKTIKYIKEYNHKNTKKNTKVEKHKRYNLEDHQIINKIKYKNDKNNNNMSKNYIKIKSKSRKNNKNILNITPKEKNSFSSKNIRSKITNKDLSINSYFDNTAKELNKEDDQNISKYKEKYNDFIIDKYSKIRDSTKEDLYIDNNKKINK